VAEGVSAEKAIISIPIKLLEIHSQSVHNCACIRRPDFRRTVALSKPPNYR
jgi:hypothetical protein